MNKQQQDRLWNELGEESKKFILNRYNWLKSQREIAIDPISWNEYQLGLKEWEEMYGEHNLNPKPQIKTWEDVEKENDFYANYINFYKTDNGNYCIDADKNYNTKIIQKAIATLKIAKLIELSYGGMVSEEEWNDESIPKECVVPVNPKGFEYTTCRYYSDKAYIAFHSIEQLVEFMSYESNKRLVEQYYMM